MKPKRHLFFSLEGCTGCRLCELVCSQANAGEYNPDLSIIQVLSNPDLGSNLVSIRKTSCVCRDNVEACVEMCNVGAIRFIDDQDVPGLLKDSRWIAAPVLE